MKVWAVWTWDTEGEYLDEIYSTEVKAIDRMLEKKINHLKNYKYDLENIEVKEHEIL